MKGFWAGFAAATVLWGGALALYATGVFRPQWAEASPEIAPDAGAVADGGLATAKETPRARRGRSGRAGGGADEAVPQGRATTGDDLGADDPRNVALGEAGGEEQLPRAAIEKGFDGVFGRIRKCLVLAAGDEPVTGKLVFGLRIAGSGEVTRVNLSGPAAASTGEAGECLRGAARSMELPSFDGPDMIVHYPITLEP